MEILFDIINKMNKQEIRFYKLQANKINFTDERKDIKLFDYIKDKNETNDETLSNLLYPNEENKNAYYRLKNRLLEDVSESLLMQYGNKEEQIKYLLWIAQTHLFINRQQKDIALYFLKKAEKKALELEDYEILDVIYTKFIFLLAEPDSPENPEPYIIKRRENNINLQKDKEISEILAAATYRLRISQNFKLNEANDIFSLLEQTIQQFNEDEKIARSKFFKKKLYSAIANTLLQKADYHNLQHYVSVTFNEFEANNYFDKNSHDFKLKMLVYLGNALFKIQNYKDSLLIAEKIKLEMQEYHGFLYNKYAFFFYNLLVMNYSVLDSKKAIDILLEVDNLNLIPKNNFYSQFIFLNLSVLYFNNYQFDNAIKALLKFYADENFKLADENFKMKIAVSEVIMRYEAKEYLILEYIIAQVNRNHKAQLNFAGNERDKEILKLILLFLKTPNLKHDEKLKKRVISFFSLTASPAILDKEVLNYNEWLKYICSKTWNILP